MFPTFGGEKGRTLIGLARGKPSPLPKYMYVPTANLPRDYRALFPAFLI